MRILNCSVNEKLSIHHAVVKMHGKKDTIYNHIKNSHITMPTEGNNFIEEDYFYVHGVKIGIEEVDLYIKLIWIKYILNNDEIKDLIMNYDIFTHNSFEPFSKFKEKAFLIFKKNKLKALLKESEYLIKIIESAGYYFSDLNFDKIQDAIFLNSVGCYGEMDNVFSLVIKEHFPEVSRKYYLFCKQSNFSRYSIGKFNNYKVKNDNQIINLFIADKNILAVEPYQVKNVLIRLNDFLIDNNLKDKTIYIPYKFGINLKNETWNRIYKMIHNYLSKDVVILK